MTTGYLTLDLLIFCVFISVSAFLYFDFEGKRLDRKYPPQVDPVGKGKPQD